MYIEFFIPITSLVLISIALYLLIGLGILLVGHKGIPKEKSILMIIFICFLILIFWPIPLTYVVVKKIYKKLVITHD